MLNGVVGTISNKGTKKLNHIEDMKQLLTLVITHIEKLS